MLRDNARDEVVGDSMEAILAKLVMLRNALVNGVGADMLIGLRSDVQF